MSKEEIKYEINKVLDRLSDKTLEDLLAFLQNFGNKDNSSILNKVHLDKILSEDNELLKKLAQ